MKTKIRFALSLCSLATALTLGCGGGSGGGGTNSSENSSSSSNSSTSIQGKLAQGYVKNAQVWFDKVGSDGIGNFERDFGERDARSEANGSYNLSNVDGEGLLVTLGGTYLDSQGNEVPAAPMLAPAPTTGQTTSNITPITTLVATEPSLKLALQDLGNWNTDIASPDGVPAPLLRLAKTVESLSGILAQGDEPIALNSAAELRSIIIFANQLATLSPSQLSSASFIESATTTALGKIFEDPTLSRNLSSVAKSSIQTSMVNLISAINTAIPSSGTVIEGEVVATIEESQAKIKATIQNELDQQVTITLGGLGFEFDPIIKQITLELINGSLRMSVDVSDERPESLQYLWTSSPRTTITNPFSSKSNIDGFDNSSITAIVRVIDDSEAYVTEVCSWNVESNPVTCNFINN